VSVEAITRLIERGRARRASDLHVDPAHGAAYRIFTRVERIPGTPPSPREIDAFLEVAMDRLSRAKLEKIGMSDCVYADDRTGAVRIHASRGRSGNRLALRLLARAIPDLEELRLPPIVAAFAELRSGLILVGGPTGAGKSTTVASVISRISQSSSRHVVTLEDPVEYQHGWGNSIVTQYEVGRDVSNFADGIRGALRADPDVIFIGELRGADTVSAALQAAETGHLVFAALHTPSETPHAVNRIVGMFGADEQERARHRLADVLRAVVGLRLVPLRDGSGLRVAAEIAVASEALRRLVRDGATHQIRATIASSRREGMQTLESHLGALVASGEIDVAVARAASAYPEEIRELASLQYRGR